MTKSVTKFVCVFFFSAYSWELALSTPSFVSSKQEWLDKIPLFLVCAPTCLNLESTDRWQLRSLLVLKSIDLFALQSEKSFQTAFLAALTSVRLVTPRSPFLWLRSGGSHAEHRHQMVALESGRMEARLFRVRWARSRHIDSVCWRLGASLCSPLFSPSHPPIFPSPSLPLLPNHTQTDRKFASISRVSQSANE